ncbi:MAG TPA: hypothetical protein VG269_02125 [Tepidisphaeraceae bacterium]|jgi:hypothetical protein|nr:hypothetical protein [Tepidisphaeraceae bacterium]
MGAQRDQYERWFANRRGPRNAADEAAALKAADAYDVMVSQGSPSNPKLDTLVVTAANPHRLVWNCAVDLLCKCLQRWPNVADTIGAMMNDRSSTARFSAMCCLKAYMPEHTADRMIRAGLSDKSGQVRWKAGEAANRLKRVEFVPALARCVAAEKPGRARRSLEHSLQMLRDGYILNPMSDGTYSLWIDTAQGSAGKSVTDEEMRSKGIEALVSEFRSAETAGN